MARCCLILLSGRTLVQSQPRGPCVCVCPKTPLLTPLFGWVSTFPGPQHPRFLEKLCLIRFLTGAVITLSIFIPGDVQKASSKQRHVPAHSIRSMHTDTHPTSSPAYLRLILPLQKIRLDFPAGERLTLMEKPSGAGRRMGL